MCGIIDLRGTILPVVDVRVVLGLPTAWRTSFELAARASIQLQTLVAELTIGETHFFRIEPQIAALRERSLPDLIRRSADNSRALNLWSAGCSTGEEPFTLAMLVDELLPSTAGWNVHIVATDLDAAALETASRAVYSEWSFRRTSDALRDRCFVRRNALAIGGCCAQHGPVHEPQPGAACRAGRSIRPDPLSQRHDLLQSRGNSTCVSDTGQ
jgi:hypothetical protein